MVSSEGATPIQVHWLLGFYGMNLDILHLVGIRAMVDDALSSLETERTDSTTPIDIILNLAADSNYGQCSIM